MFTHLHEVRQNHDEKSLRAIHSRTCAAVERLGLSKPASWMRTRQKCTSNLQSSQATQSDAVERAKIEVENEAEKVDASLAPVALERDTRRMALPANSAQARSHSNASAAIPAAVAHQVHRRDHGRCQARLPNGTLCGSSLWVELHHIQPRSQGGLHAAGNLITMCRSHHQAWHAGT